MVLRIASSTGLHCASLMIGPLIALPVTSTSLEADAVLAFFNPPMLDALIFLRSTGASLTISSNGLLRSSSSSSGITKWPSACLLDGVFEVK